MKTIYGLETIPHIFKMSVVFLCAGFGSFVFHIIIFVHSKSLNTDYIHYIHGDCACVYLTSVPNLSATLIFRDDVDCCSCIVAELVWA